MTALTALLDDRDDASLIAAVRDGDTEAYGVLFERHVDAARRLARSLAGAGDADDLVSEAFAKVLPVLVRGDGPEVAFRSYLLTAVRRLDVDRHRALARTRPTDDETLLDRGEPFSDPAVAGFEATAAARAFASLPERWQMVLWHTEVEGQRPATVAPLMGLSPNAVSQLAHRAREGLRQAFVSMHVHEAAEARLVCQTTRANLGAYVRAGLSPREANRVSAHLECCRPCTAIYLELVEVDTDLRGLLAPLLLGGAATAYLADVPVSVAPGALASAGELLRSGPGKALAGTAAAGVTLAALVLGGTTLMSPDPRPGTDPGVIAAPAVPRAPQGTTGGGRPGKPRPPATPVTAGSGGSGVQPATQAPATQGADQAPAQAPAPGQTAVQPVTWQGTGNGNQNDGGQNNGGQNNGGGTGVVTESRPDNEVDVRVTASRGGIGPAAVVTVNVAGLAPSQSGTVMVSADRLAATVNLDPRCDLIGVNQASCRLDGSGSLQMLAASLPLPTVLTITATPGPGLTDPSMDDNTTHVTLG